MKEKNGQKNTEYGYFSGSVYHETDKLSGVNMTKGIQYSDQTIAKSKHLKRLPFFLKRFMTEVFHFKYFFLTEEPINERGNQEILKVEQCQDSDLLKQGI